MQIQRAVQTGTDNPVHQRSAPTIKVSSPVHAPVHPILRLQQNMGNQAVQRMLRLHHLQAKLKIGQPGDIFEQEADRVAEQVMRMPEPTVQRACAACAAGESRCPTCEAEEKLVQRKMESAPDSSDTVAPDKFRLDLGPGQALDPSIRTFFEPRFGHDFSQVRVHTDARAAESALAVNALAYTVGQDVVFGAGQYKPRTSEGRWLLGHELAHVVQQRNLDFRCVQRQPAPTPPPHIVSCAGLTTPTGNSETVKNDANVAAIQLLDRTRTRLNDLISRAETGGFGNVPPGHQDTRTLQAAIRQLHVDLERRQEFLNVVRSARDRIHASLVKNVNLVDRPGIDPAHKCGSGACEIASAVTGDTEGVINLCDLFYWSNELCQRNVILHERFHLVGIPGSHHGKTTNPNQSSDFMDNLIDLVLDVSGEAVISVCKLVG